MISVPSSHQRPAGQRWRTALAVLIGLVAVLAGPAVPASAHAALVGSSPAADAVLQDAPKQVVLTFTESVNPVAGKVKVLAPDGTRVDKDDARTSGQQLIIALKDVSTVGTYLVTYRVISADSHPVGGQLLFSYKQTSTPPNPDASVQAAAWVVDTLPVVRWIGFVGLIALVGAAIVLILLWPARLDRTGPTKVAYLGAGLIALATVLELALQVPYVAGGGLGNITGSEAREVLSSQFGAAHLIRLGVLGAALVLLRAIVQGKGWGADRVLLGVLAVIGVATWSMSGHPSATDIPVVSVVSDMIHLASMSVWVGGLAMLAIFLLPRANAGELAAIVPVWSRWATYAVGALLLTGLAQALIEVRTVDALLHSAYGLTIIAKVALVAVVLLAALGSHRLVGAISLKQEGAAKALRRVVAVEASVALVIIALTSVLVQLTPARNVAASSQTQPGVQSASMTDPRFVLNADLTPATVGTDQLHLYATTPDGRPATVLEWTVKASKADGSGEPIQAVVTKITADHAIGQIGLPSAGQWKFVFTLRLTDIDSGTVSSTFTVG